MWQNVTDRAGGRWLIWLMLIAILPALSSCQTAPEVVKIGLVAPFDGKLRFVGYDVIYSTRLAVREINEAGGIAGKRVALVALDDGGNPILAQQAAASLAVDPNVMVVLGHWEPATTELALPIYEEASLPLGANGRNPIWHS